MARPFPWLPNEGIAQQKNTVALTDPEVLEVYRALKEVLAYPRWLSIGHLNNAVELRPGKATYERAAAARDLLKARLDAAAKNRRQA